MIYNGHLPRRVRILGLLTTSRGGPGMADSETSLRETIRLRILAARLPRQSTGYVCACRDEVIGSHELQHDLEPGPYSMHLRCYHLWRDGSNSIEREILNGHG